MKSMGELIAQKRKELGMTQAELAAKLNVTDKAVSKWERDLSCPDIHSLSALAQALHIPVTELLNEENLSYSSAKQSNLHSLIPLILKAVALAMGVGVFVLSLLSELTVTSGFSMLSIGVFCIALWALIEKN